MIPVCFFQMMGVCVTLSWLIIQSSEAITFLKEYIQSYKTPQILPLTKWIGGLIMKQFLEVTGDKGVIRILMNLKHKVLVAEARLPNSKYVTLHENYLMWDQCQISPIRYDGGPTTNKKLHPHLSIYFVQEFGGVIPPQNMLKMFPQISGLENIAFIKGWYGDLAITIDAQDFHLDYPDLPNPTLPPPPQCPPFSFT